MWECWLIVQDAADRCHYTFSLLLGFEKLKSLAILHQLQKESIFLTYINFIKLLKAFKQNKYAGKKEKTIFSKRHTYSKFASWLGGGIYVCLKRLSFHSLIHFYKRFV